MKITGNVTIREDGEELLTDGKDTLNPGGYEREAMMGGRGVNGYKQTPVAPSVQCTIHHTNRTDLIRLAGITDGTLLLETDTGQAWMLRGAFVTEPPELDVGAGTCVLNFSGYGLDRV